MRLSAGALRVIRVRWPAVLHVAAARSRLRRHWFVLAAFICGLALPLSASALPGRITIEPPSGLPVLWIGGMPAVRTTYAFWNKGWAWAGTDAKLSFDGPLTYSTTARNESLGLDIGTAVRRTSPREVTMVFTVNARRTVPDAIGGGLAFALDRAAFTAHLGEPQLLPGNRGWAWGRPGATRIEVRFDPPLPAVVFKDAQKDEVRGAFYGAVEPGLRTFSVTLAASQDIVFGPGMAERLGPEDAARWPESPLDSRRAPVDLSFLNADDRPAGRRGFVRAVDDRLVFADGTPARFWGTNLTAYALFTTSPEGIKQAARRLAQLGFNLVRLHHHDSDWVNPNVFGKPAPASTRQLDPAALDKIDLWVSALKAEGIYVWLDLHVGRQLRAGDGITAFDEIRKGAATADLRGYNYVNRSIEAAMQAFNTAYLDRVNRYTGIAYKDEPAVAGLLITNENDLTNHFGNSLLPDKNVPRHSAAYMRKADEFARANGLPRDQTWRSWEHGPSKLLLNDLEQQFHQRMIAQLRSLGMDVPVAATSQWGLNTLASLPALTVGDLIDAHEYGDTGELEKNPLFGATFVHSLAAAQVAGKPFSVTEWNLGTYPAADRHTAPLYVAAAASHQGWDAVMLYAYSQGSQDGAGNAGQWEAWMDPSLIATMPAAALMFRRGDVRAATTTYVFAPSRELLYYRPLSARTAVALRTAAELGRLLIALPPTRELPWLGPSVIPPGAIVLTDPDRPLLAADATGSVSDTGELRRSWADGTLTLDTPRTKAVTGWIGGRSVRLGADVVADISTPYASVTVQSLTPEAIGKSRALLVSLGSRSSTTSPLRAEPVTGTLLIRAPPGVQLRLWTDPRRAPVALTYRDGFYRIELGAALGSQWLVLSDA
jgi:hypothetical protein